MFQKKIVEKYLLKLDSKILVEKYIKYCSIFANKQKQENIRNSKEEQYQEGFVRDLFCSVLGYTIKPEENYNILTELKNESKSNSKKSDAAIIINNQVKAVIELKGTDTQDLDKVAFQAFSYKNHHEKCNYVIVSNFERLRLYVETQIEYTEFNLFNLSKEKFDLLYLLLSLDNITSDVPLKLKHETLTEEIEITNNFYTDYSAFKRALFEDLTKNNPDIDKLLLFKKTQKLLDRLLFVMFCEDRNLLPTNSTLGIINDYKKLKEMGYYQPLYNFFKVFFERIDKGFTHEVDHSKDIFAYNGGLFKPDEILDNIKIGDDVLLVHCPKLANYDFASQISVDILGRIFENSLTEIEEVQNEIENEKNGIKQKNSNIGKRKKDGVFYTPEYITKYIVENTIGKLCEEKKNELIINDTEFTFDKKYQKKKIEELDERLNKYRNWLLNLKILDCACGSGAFLNAALKELRKEHTLIDKFWSKIHRGELNFSQIDNTILENNLYGVDINDDSIEITKLSLWLHTATPNRKLTTLNDKIKCGNSLIDDASVAGEKAFVWEKEFPEVFTPFHKGGCHEVTGGFSENREQKDESGVIGVGCDRCDCRQTTGEDGLKLSLEGEKKREGDRIRSESCSLEQSSSKADAKNTPLISHLSSLTSQLKGGFDVVIGNPPYVFAREKVSDAEKAYYVKYYKSAKYQVNTYILFIELCQRLLKPNGYCGLIVPNSWLMVYSGEDLRKYLLEKVTINQIVNLLGKSFEDASVETVILLDQKCIANENHKIEICINDDEKKEFKKSHEIKQFDFSKNKGLEFTVFKNDESSNLIEKIKENCLGLDEAACVKTGLKAYQKGKGTPKQTEETVKSRPFDFTYKFDENTYMYLDGANVKRYAHTWSGMWLQYGKHLAETRNLELFTCEKIIIREITGQYPKCINATYLNETYLFNCSNIAIISRNTNFSLKYILALLNSSLMSYYFKKNTAKAERKLFPKIILNDLRLFPIKQISLDQQKPFIDLADKMLSLNEDLQKKTTRFISRIKETYCFEKTTQNIENFYKLTFTDFVKELSKVKVKLSMKQKDELEDYFNDYVKNISTLNAQIEATDDEINNLVYKLYNLTDEEIKIITG